MIGGLLLLLATGVLWAGLAVVMAESSRRKLDTRMLLLESAVFVLLTGGWWCLFQGPLTGSGKQLTIQLLAMIGAGVLNYLMLQCVNRAMRTGNGGVIWGITQSSLVLPFLMGIFFFHERSNGLRLSGVFLVLLALFFFSLTRNGKGTVTTEKGWLFFALLAFVLSGAAQCAASLPSYWQLSGMTAMRRMALMQFGMILAAGCCGRYSPGRSEQISSVATGIAAVVFGGCNLVALCCFYNGLNGLADAGYAAIGYPMGQGISIVVFCLIGRIVYQERMTPVGILALTVMLTGLLLLIVGIF